jgi:hypothetical protein
MITGWTENVVVVVELTLGLGVGLMVIEESVSVVETSTAWDLFALFTEVMHVKCDALRYIHIVRGFAFENWVLTLGFA